MNADTLNDDVNEFQIKLLIENWAKAVRNRDLETILSHHSNNIVMYDVPKPFQSVGITAYSNTWDSFFTYSKPGALTLKN